MVTSLEPQASVYLLNRQIEELIVFLTENALSVKGDAPDLISPIVIAYLDDEISKADARRLLEVIAGFCKPKLCIINLLDALVHAREREKALAGLDIVLESLGKCLCELDPVKFWPDPIQVCRNIVRDSNADETFLQKYARSFLAELLAVSEHSEVVIALLELHSASVTQLPPQSQDTFFVDHLRPILVKIVPDLSYIDKIPPHRGLESQIVEWLCYESVNYNESRFFPLCYDPVFKFLQIVRFAAPVLQKSEPKHKCLKLLCFHLRFFGGFPDEINDEPAFSELVGAAVNVMVYCSDQVIRGDCFRLVNSLHSKLPAMARTQFYHTLFRQSDNSSLKSAVIKWSSDSVRIFGDTCDDFIGERLLRLCKTFLYLRLEESEEIVFTVPDLMERKEEIIATVNFFALHCKTPDLQGEIVERFKRLYVKNLGSSLRVMREVHMQRSQEVQKSPESDEFETDLMPGKLKKREYLDLLGEMVNTMDLIMMSLALVKL